MKNKVLLWTANVFLPNITVGESSFMNSFHMFSKAHFISVSLDIMIEDLPCEVLMKDYRNVENLREYIRNIHEGRFNHCDVWRKDYWNKKYLKEHVRTVHGKEIRPL